MSATRGLRRKLTTRSKDWHFLLQFTGWVVALVPILPAHAQSQSFTNTAALKAHQQFTLTTPPAPPDTFNPDSGRPPFADPLFSEDTLRLRLRSWPSNAGAPLPPAQFNPDPGAGRERRLEYVPEFRYLEATGQEPIAPELKLPRQPARRSEIVEDHVSEKPDEPALPDHLKLPRFQTRYNEAIDYEFRSSDIPVGTPREEFPPYTFPQRDRWHVGFTPWRRYTQGSAETPYETPVPRLWHPYKQSVLKGDVPIIGQDIFLNLTASSVTEFEARRLPTPSGVSAARPGSSEFFGRGEQFTVQQYLGFSIDLFRGETAFRPVSWAFHIQPVFNVNYVDARETGVISPDPRGSDARTQPIGTPVFVTGPGQLEGLLQRVDDDLAGRAHTTRTKNYLALQEAFAEVHLADLSDNYDFIALRAGNQVFNSDFRGFIFNDVNLGVRLFGNASNNRYQYNVAVFDMREKDTNSELNTFEDRDQSVLVANLYRQDFLWHGYTAQLSFHANWDDGGLHYDRNGSVVRPEPLGALKEHSVNAYYLGWAGDGHIGPLNISHAFYQAFGTDQYNGLAGHEVDISAQMAALELSLDRDWIRYKASFFYASGDANAEDHKGEGFDSIVDNPNFTGGPFSYYVRQGFNLAGTAVGLKQRASLLPDLRSSKTEGQANFVNPGLFLFGVGTEMDLTPKLRNFINLNYVRFAETNPIETALLMNDIDHEIGFDLSIGFQYRPFLTDNVIISCGFGTLLPGAGYRDVYRRMHDPVPGVTTHGTPGAVDDFLYSGLLVLNLTF